MLDSRRGRILAVMAVLTCHVLLFSLYAQQPINPAAHVYPGVEEFVENPDRYIGQRVVLTGFVQGVSPLSVRVSTTSGTHLIRLTETTLPASVGDKVRVIGELTATRTVRVIDGFVVPPRGSWYAWSVSFLSGLWVLGRLDSHWRVDIATFGFEPRDRPRALWNRIRTRFDSEDDN